MRKRTEKELHQILIAAQSMVKNARYAQARMEISKALLIIRNLRMKRPNAPAVNVGSVFKNLQGGGDATVVAYSKLDELVAFRMGESETLHLWHLEDFLEVFGE